MPPSPPVIETRPEFVGLHLTSTTPLTNAERLRLWHAKNNITELEAWKKRTRKEQS